jgi:hypothetical protein
MNTAVFIASVSMKACERVDVVIASAYHLLFQEFHTCAPVEMTMQASSGIKGTLNLHTVKKKWVTTLLNLTAVNCYHAQIVPHRCAQDFTRVSGCAAPAYGGTMSSILAETVLLSLWSGSHHLAVPHMRPSTHVCIALALPAHACVARCCPPPFRPSEGAEADALPACGVVPD